MPAKSHRRLLSCPDVLAPYGRATTLKSRAKSIVQSLFFVLLVVVLNSPSCVAYTRTCSLDDVPISTIEVPPIDQLESSNGRHLRGDTSRFLALAVSRDQVLDSSYPTGRNLFDATNNDSTSNSNSKSETVSFQGRRCDCASHLYPKNTDFYCPASQNQCTTWTRRNKKFRVYCTEANWRVGYARYIWYYLVFAFCMLFTYLFCSRPGHHVIKYVIASCLCIDMNLWIADQIYNIEMEQRERVIEEYLYGMHVVRRTVGWVSGYKLKTKIFSEDMKTNSGDEEGGENTEGREGSTIGIGAIDSKDDGFCDNKDCDCDNSVAADTNTNNAKVCSRCSNARGAPDTCSAPAFGDVCSVGDEEHVCTICLLSLEHGDRIADLSCGHLYHADCLSEWVLKKNVCPLCQEPNVAEELRSFETEEDFAGSTHSSRPPEDESILARWRRRTREKFVAFATGRNTQMRQRDVHRVIYQMFQ